MPPVNDDIAAAIVLSGLRGSASFSTVDATTEPDESWPNSTVWFAWTAPAGTAGYAVQMDLRATPDYASWSQPLLTVYQLEDGQPLAEANLDWITDDDEGEPAAQFWAASGVTYYVQVGSWDVGAVSVVADGVLRWAAAEHTVGPWVQPDDHDVTTTAMSGRNGYSSDGGPAGDAASNTAMWDGTGTVTQDQSLYPTYRTQPTSTGVTDAYAAVELINYDLTSLPSEVDDPDPTPSDYVSLEYDPLDANTLTSPLALHLETATQTLSWGTYPSDLGVSVRRIPPTDYDLDFGVAILPAGQNWWSPDDVTAWTELVDIPHGSPGHGFTRTADLTFDASDADSNGQVVMWLGIDYFPASLALLPDGSGFPAVTPQIQIRATIHYTYRPRRHRYIYPASWPPFDAVAVTEVWAHVEGSVGTGTEVWG